MTASIAYLVLAHRAPEQLRSLAKVLASNGGRVFVHVDAKAALDDFAEALRGLQRVQMSPQPLPIWWGGFNMVAATLHLCRAALDAGAERLVLLSGADFPIKQMHHVESDLSKPLDRIEMLTLPNQNLGTDGGVGRFRLVHRVDACSRVRLPPFLLPALHRTLAPWLKRQPPMGLVPIVGSQWWALQAETVRAVIDFFDHHLAVERYFRGCGVPDESLFQTLIHHLCAAVPRTGHGRLIIWDRHPMPYVFRLQDWDELMASDALFARKFDFERDPELMRQLLTWHRQEA
jgi:hypothetical protein